MVDPATYTARQAPSCIGVGTTAVGASRSGAASMGAEMMMTTTDAGVVSGIMMMMILTIIIDREVATVADMMMMMTIGESERVADTMFMDEGVAGMVSTTGAAREANMTTGAREEDITVMMIKEKTSDYIHK